MKFSFTKMVLGLGLATVLGWLSPVQAQVAVSPMVVRTETRQGQASGVITLRNKGNQPARMRLYAEPFTYGQDGFKTESESPNDLSPFLLFSPRELTIQPGQSRRVRFISRLLPSLEGREYRAAIFVEPLRDVSEVTTGLRVNTRIGVTVYVRHGELSPELRVEGAEFDAKDKRFEVLVGNEGTASIAPRVEWRLQQGENLVAQDDIGAITVIAEGKRQVPINLPQGVGPLASGNYQLQGELIWGDRLYPETLPFNFDLMVP